MPKQKFERTKPHILIGTIGHVDHDKTTLTEAINKYLSEHRYNVTDNVPQINGKGITINPSVIEEKQKTKIK